MVTWLESLRARFFPSRAPLPAPPAVVVAAPPRSSTPPPHHAPATPPPAETLAATLKITGAQVPASSSSVDPPSPREREAIRQTLRDLRQIPALRSLAQRFSIALHREKLTVTEVVEPLRRDPALCVRLLQLANSAAVAPGEPVSDLSTAVQLLGVPRVRLLASAILLQRDGDGLGGDFDWKHLWVHALATALLAEHLDAWSGHRAGDSLPACAILHDVGKIALSVVAPEAYREVLLQTWRDRLSLTALELARLGVDHREAGKLFGQSAGLPPPVLDAIAWHDSPAFAQAPHRELVALVGVANQWAKIRGLGFSGDGLIIEQDLWETPAWAAWARALPTPPDPCDFAELEPRWIEQTKETLHIVRG
jgi:HD-like signal output (HDOD) protein